MSDSVVDVLCEGLPHRCAATLRLRTEGKSLEAAVPAADVRSMLMRVSPKRTRWEQMHAAADELHDDLDQLRKTVASAADEGSPWHHSLAFLERNCHELQYRLEQQTTAAETALIEAEAAVTVEGRARKRVSARMAVSLLRILEA